LKTQTIHCMSGLGYKLRSFSSEIWNCPPCSEGRERLKKEADYSRWWVAGLICKGTYIQVLSWVTSNRKLNSNSLCKKEVCTFIWLKSRGTAGSGGSTDVTWAMSPSSSQSHFPLCWGDWTATRQADHCTHPPNLTSLYRGFTWVQSLSGWSQQHLTLSRLHPWKWFPPWERWAWCRSQGWGGNEEPLIAEIQLISQLSVTSSWLSPPKPFYWLLGNCQWNSEFPRLLALHW